MTTMNKQARKDLDSYKKKTLWSAGILVVAIAVLFAVSYFLQATQLYQPLLGALVGVLCATLNLFAIGYAFYVIAIVEGKKAAILLPVVSFAGICVIVYMFANYWPACLLGFALGLTAPILFGAAIIFLN